MKVLVVPMFALSPMGGPWSRAQRIASSFLAAGHDVILGFADDGNCEDPVTERTLQLPAPSPLGLPMAIASRTFPLANKLGIAGRKPVRSFEEVLWLTGALAYRYERESVEIIRRFLRNEQPDVVYSEFNLPAIIASQAERVPCVGTASLPTRASYACDPEKAGGIRRLLDELKLPSVTSSLALLDRMKLRFVPSCPALEPLEGDGIVFCGFLGNPAHAPESQRDAIVIYMGTGSVPGKALEESARGLAKTTGREVFAAGYPGPRRSEGKLHLARRFDFSSLLPRALLFVNHGGQNSVMDALAQSTPQAIFPGNVFERQFNAASIVKAEAGIKLSEFSASSLADAVERTASDASLREGARRLQAALSSLGGTATIVDRTERLVS